MADLLTYGRWHVGVVFLVAWLLARSLLRGEMDASDSDFSLWIDVTTGLRSIFLSSAQPGGWLFGPDLEPLLRRWTSNLLMHCHHQLHVTNYRMSQNNTTSTHTGSQYLTRNVRLLSHACLSIARVGEKRPVNSSAVSKKKLEVDHN